MKFGIVVAEDIPKARDLAKKVKKYLETRGHEVLDTNLTRSDLVVTLGGDGILLHAACEHVELNVPFVGINAGTLGFLTAAEGSEWQGAIEKLIDGKYFISERMTLEAGISKNFHLRGVRALRYNSGQAHLEGGNFRALNEVVVKGMYRVVDLEITVNGQKFLEIVGDGVIVSTQTGSTAYSLSAGGPIVEPEVDCFLITPINAVGLPIPSVALSPNDVVEIKVRKGDDVSLIVDGQEHTKISQSPADAKVFDLLESERPLSAMSSSFETLNGRPNGRSRRPEAQTRRALACRQSVKVERGRYRVKFGYFDKQHFLKALNAKFGLSGRVFR